MVIQAFLFWLAASSDGLSGHQTSDKKLLLVLKCAHTKRNMSPIKLVQGTNFYMNLKNGKAVLKKKTFFWILLTNAASDWTFRFP